MEDVYKRQYLRGKNHEAYGEEFFLETTKYNPQSPYSASKASSDHFVRAFHDTYGMPTIVTNCSNNYGPYGRLYTSITRQDLIDEEVARRVAEAE